MAIKINDDTSLKILPKKIKYNDKYFSLLLRPLEECDATVINNSIKESIRDLQPFMDWSHRELSVEGQIERILKSKKNYFSYKEFDFVVLDGSNGEFLMSASLSSARAPNKNALGIGYWTSSKHCNKGIATIVTKILIVVAFEFMECDRLEIGCNKKNTKSLKIIKKCGFNFEGEAHNYFTKPTTDMILNGYFPERICSQFVLFPQDIENLSWYNDVSNGIEVDNFNKDEIE